MREEIYTLSQEENIQWDFLLLGLRKHFNLSQKELSEKIDVSRRQIGKYERRYRTPNRKVQEEILSYVGSLGITLSELIQEGKEYIHPKNLRTIKEKGDIAIDANLGELIGIILGDGEVSLDGNIRISFNHHNEREYIQDRTVKLLEKFSQGKITYESKKRLSVNDKKFVLWLKETGIEPGSKFKNSWSVSERILRKKSVRRGILRGLFDTAGTFYFKGPKQTVSFGRFSERSMTIVNLVCQLLEREGISYSKSQSRDSRWRVRVTNDPEVRAFFVKVGSSNYKHIIRYMVWRKSKEPVEIKGRPLADIAKDADIDPSDIKIPYKSKAKEDKEKVEGRRFKDENDIEKIASSILEKYGYRPLVEKCEVGKRNIRKWKNGKRVPSPENAFKIKKIAESMGLL